MRLAVTNIVLICTWLLTSCAHNCYTQTFYKAYAQSYSDNSRIGDNHSLFIRLHENNEIELFECGFSKRREDKGPSGICLNLLVQENNTLSLTNKKFKILDFNNSILGVGVLSDHDYKDELQKIYFAGKHKLNIDLPFFVNNEFIIEINGIEINNKLIAPVVLKFIREEGRFCYVGV